MAGSAQHCDERDGSSAGRLPWVTPVVAELDVRGNTNGGRKSNPSFEGGVNYRLS